MKWVFLVLALIPALVFAQSDGSFKKPEAKKVVGKSDAPVTKDEVRKTMIRVWTVVSKGLKLQGTLPFKAEVLSGVASKEDVLADFDAVLNAVKGQFKRSPRPMAFDTARFRKDGNVARMSGLARVGLVAPVGPLMTGANASGLTPLEFGDAVGSFMVRLADLLHLPNTKISPSLMGG